MKGCEILPSTRRSVMVCLICVHGLDYFRKEGSKERHPGRRKKRRKRKAAKKGIQVDAKKVAKKDIQVDAKKAVEKYIQVDARRRRQRKTYR